MEKKEAHRGPWLNERLAPGMMPLGIVFLDFFTGQYLASLSYFGGSTYEKKLMRMSGPGNLMGIS